MEKLGISNEELLKELRGEYARLRELEAAAIKKQASVSLENRHAMEAIKSKIDELEVAASSPNSVA